MLRVRHRQTDIIFSRPIIVVARTDRRKYTATDFYFGIVFFVPRHAGRERKFDRETACCVLVVPKPASGLFWGDFWAQQHHPGKGKGYTCIISYIVSCQYTGCVDIGVNMTQLHRTMDWTTSFTHNASSYIRVVCFDETLRPSLISVFWTSCLALCNSSPMRNFQRTPAVFDGATALVLPFWRRRLSFLFHTAAYRPWLLPHTSVSLLHSTLSNWHRSPAPFP